MKTQSFSTLRTAGMPSIQAFKYSHLGQDPESDALLYDEYQKEREEALNAMTTIGGGGNTAAGNNVTSYGEDDEDDDEDGNESNASDSGSFGVCPVCGQRFKKRNGNQVYDREECRRMAQKRKRGAMI